MQRLRQFDLVYLLELFKVEDQHVFFEDVKELSIGRYSIAGHKAEWRVKLTGEIECLRDFLIREIDDGEFGLFDFEAIDLLDRDANRGIQQLVLWVRRKSHYPHYAISLIEDEMIGHLAC